MRLHRLLLMMCLLSFTALGATASWASAVTVGIADQKPAMFADPRFSALNIRTVRLAVPWDILTDVTRRPAVDLWLRAAQAKHQQVLVTWDRSARHPRSNPSTAAFTRQFNAFRKAYPFVKDYSTWNEANINKQPRLVAAWWRALRRACPTCRVLAADLLDRGNAISWARRFVKAAHSRPSYWGLHSYEDANRFSTARTRRILRAISGRIWITETGGVLSRHNHSQVAWKGSGADHAAKATRWLLQRVARVSPRIERIYIYNWNADSANATWDSALVGPDGTARPALGILGAQR